jgi:hypothetical protein
LTGSGRGTLESCRPVWLALSELFLDTELQEDALRRIARTLAASGHGLSELERVLWAEVAPVVGWNLLGVAGVWDGFDPVWLEDGILRRLRHNARQGRLFRSLGVRLARLLWARSIQADWARVRVLLPQDDAPA